MTKYMIKKFIEVTALAFQYIGNEMNDNPIFGEVKRKVCINADCIIYLEESDGNGSRKYYFQFF